jgi:hypothetical protein
MIIGKVTKEKLARATWTKGSKYTPLLDAIRNLKPGYNFAVDPEEDQDPDKFRTNARQAYFNARRADESIPKVHVYRAKSGGLIIVRPKPENEEPEEDS